jgi:hypothetical protein
MEVVAVKSVQAAQKARNENWLPVIDAIRTFCQDSNSELWQALESVEF